MLREENLDQSRSPLLISEAEAARLLGVSPLTLRDWRLSGGDCPPWRRVGPKLVRYDAKGVENWAKVESLA